MGAIGLMTMATPQHDIETLLLGLRAGAPESRIVLSLDSPRGVTSLDSLAAIVDILAFSREPRGFGVARQRLLRAGDLLGSAAMVIADGDDQFPAEAVLTLYYAGAAAPRDRLILGQRSQRSLPLAEAMTLRRETLERFENWVLARKNRRPELAGRDLQPGAFCVVGERVIRRLAEVREDGFAWDLAMVHRCLEDDVPVDHVDIEARVQRTTSFTRRDAIEKLVWLRSRFGPLETEIEAFLGSDQLPEAEARALADAVVLG